MVSQGIERMGWQGSAIEMQVVCYLSQEGMVAMELWE